MNRPIRLGVFGLGQVYRQLYAPAVAIRRDFCVAATADPAVPADFSQPEALLAGAEVDAILVLSPPPLHARHVALALDRGLPVLVEKPPALTVAEAEDWPNPVLLTCAFSRRYW